MKGLPRIEKSIKSYQVSLIEISYKSDRFASLNCLNGVFSGMASTAVRLLINNLSSYTANQIYIF